MPHNGTSQSDYLAMRYAHPFFTTVPPEKREPIEGLNASRMAEFIAQSLGPIPKPKRKSAMKLAEVIGEAGVQEIETVGSISFHATGDTGQQNVVHECSSGWMRPLRLTTGSLRRHFLRPAETRRGTR